MTLEWNDNNDPENPRNWSKWKKSYHTAVPAGVSFLLTFTSTAYVPGHLQVMEEFSCSEITSELPFALSVLGLAFGPVLAAPLSETFGRRAIYLTSIPTFGLFILGASFSKSLAALAICRFLAAIFGSPCATIGNGVVADIWSPNERSVPMAFFAVMPFVAPAVGSSIGAALSESTTWRWTQWVALTLFPPAFACVLLFQETYKEVILTKRSQKNKLGEACNFRLLSWQKFREFITTTLMRPLRMFFTEPIVGLLSTYVAFNIAIIYACYPAIPYVYAAAYGFSIRSSGFVFFALSVGCICGIFTVFAVQKVGIWEANRLNAKSGQQEDGNATPIAESPSKTMPEQCLWMAKLGSPFLPASLFWFGWSAQAGVHWICPTTSLVIFAWANFLVWMSAGMYLVNAYGPLYAASAIAANRFLQFLLGFAFPLFAVQMFRGLSTGWASSLLGFISLAMVPLPWIFQMYGPKIRGKSKYTTSE